MSNLDQNSENLFSGTGNGTSKENNSFMENLKGNKKIADLIKLVVIFLLSLGLYSISVALLPSGMSYFVRHLVAVIISLLFLWGYSIIQKEPSIYGDAIIIFMVMFFIFNISSHYFVKNNKEISKEINIPKKNEERTMRILNYGSTVFELKAGESTPWLKFPNGCVRYDTSSKLYRHVLEFSDGTSYRNSKNLFIPQKNNVKLKILALEDEVITVVIS